MPITKAQSAMEYLMTYGWAILIIAVVLGALFQLGVFSGSSLTGSACVAAPGFYCQNAELQNTAGDNGLAFTFGQSLGVTIYNIALACSYSANAIGYPYLTPFNDLSAGGSILPTLGTAGTSLTSGQTISIGTATGANNLPCMGSNQKYDGVGSHIGTSFSGYIWLNYTTQTGAPAAGTNPWYTAKIATLNLKVT